MKTTIENLPQSRTRVVIEPTALEVTEAFEQALAVISSGIKVTGFRSGKAPAEMVRAQIDSEKLRDEASTIIVRRAWQQAVTELKELPIQDPEVTIETFEEAKDAKLVFEFDIRPAIKLGDWQKIKVKKEKTPEVPAGELDEVLSSLQYGQAATVVSVEPAKAGDKVEVSFSGYVNNIRLDKLTAKNFTFIIGRDNVIPGFAEQLSGLKKGDTKTFELEFPKDHFDPELAEKKVKFEVSVDEVFTVVLPAVDEAMAKKFGHDTPEQLREAIAADLVKEKVADLEAQLKAKWLAEFEQKITTDLPHSLLAAEVERSEKAWQEFLSSRQLNAEDWLKRQNITIEKLREDWQKAASSTVKIGLGIGEVARAQGRELKTNDDFQNFLTELVEKASA
jgi:trigger factor